MEKLLLEDKKAVEKLEQLKEKGLILFEAIVGSQAYGTNLPTSDIDRKFVYIDTFEDLLSDNGTRQLNVTKDYTGYEIGRFLELLETQNPNTQEILYSPLGCIEFCHPLFKELLIDNRNKFLSKKCAGSFGGYANTQIQKARGLNKKIVNPVEPERKGLLDFCWVVKKQGSIPLKEFIEKSKMRIDCCGVVAIDHMKNCYNLFYHSNYAEFLNTIEQDPSAIEDMFCANPGYKGITDKDDVQIVLSSVEKGEKAKTMFYCNIEAFQSHCKLYREYFEWVEKRNPERYKDNLNVDAQFDTKNLMHCHRLLDMSIEILETNTINVRRPNREQLLEIKAGKYKYEQLIDDANKKIELINKLVLVSSLPDETDSEFIKTILITLRKKFYNL